MSDKTPSAEQAFREAADRQPALALRLSEPTASALPF
jgi:hypothetical protein